jgi:hypothetical protein
MSVRNADVASRAELRIAIIKLQGGIFDVLRNIPLQHPQGFR